MLTDIGRKPLLVPAGLPALLSSIVHERTGIYFEPERHNVLLEKLQPLAEERGCYSFLDYYYLLKYEENGTEDWERVMDAISVQETYFWREMPQIHALVKVLVPQWFQRFSSVAHLECCQRNRRRGLHDCHGASRGGCNHPIEIYASDGSLSALQKARHAVFRENSFRALPVGLRENLFVRPRGLEPSSGDIPARHLSTSQSTGGQKRSTSWPVRRSFSVEMFLSIFRPCDSATLATFASRMPSQGHLFVGASESLLRLTADFELREVGDAFVYVKT